jgi:hypothetical protein
MNKYVQRSLFAVVLVTLLGFAGKGMNDAFHKPAASVSVKVPATIPAGNKAPSEEFLVDYANFKKLQKEVRDLQADSKLIEKQRLLQGTIDALNAQIPAGYVWDEDTTSFKLRTLTPTPPAPAKP